MHQALLLVFSAATSLAQVELYIAPNGNDTNPGTLAAPFASLEHARDEIRKMKKGPGLPKKGVTIFLRKGIYERNKPFELGKEDSGTTDARIVYRSYPNETARIVGGKVVKHWKPVIDPGVLNQLPKKARGKVWKTSLKEQGIADLGIVAIQDPNKQRPDQRIELFFNNEPMTLSRYPNEGFIKIVDLLGGKPLVVRSTHGDSVGKFTCDSDRLARWIDEKDPWVHGYWFWDWSDQRHKVKVIDPARRSIEVEEPYHGYGYRKGHWFYALNLLSEIHSVCFESNDAGAIYAGRDWTARGTVIRNNYLHHISGFRGRGCVGVYLDDMYCGTEISSNVFYRVPRAAFIGGGRDCLVENNIFVDCPKALHIDARALGWAHAHADRWLEEARTKGTLSGFKYKEPPYSTRWPALANILEGEPKAPEGNIVRRNIFVGAPWKDVHLAADKYITYEDNLAGEDVKFVDYAKQNFQLRDDSPAYRKIGFQRIPIEKIGLYNNARRASWPVASKVRLMPDPPAKHRE